MRQFLMQATAPLVAVLAGLLTALTTGAVGAPPLAQSLLPEDVIMRKLRRRMEPMSRESGWQPDNPAHHCTWASISCNQERQVIAITVRVPDMVGIVLKKATSSWRQQQRQEGGEGEYSDDIPTCGGGAPQVFAPFLPELAQLQYLELLELEYHSCTVQDSIPKEWVSSGSFLKLQTLMLVFESIQGGLPEIQQGAFPHLLSLHLDIYDMLPSTLPPSWGGPSLSTVGSLLVRAPLLGPLPRDWASDLSGFRYLTIYNTTGEGTWLPYNPAGSPAPAPVADNTTASTHQHARTQETAAPLAATAAQTTPAVHSARLPAEWSHGFRVLQMLRISRVAMTGTLPTEWVQGGFPLLTELAITSAGLTGTLPAELFKNHPQLDILSVSASSPTMPGCSNLLTPPWPSNSLAGVHRCKADGIPCSRLSGNQLTGTLPAEWANSKVKRIVLRDNFLTGPAFPPAWLEPGAFPELLSLDLAGNQGLTGTLPPDLAWPKLETLMLNGTGVAPIIPSSWCKAPFKPSLSVLELNLTNSDPCPPPCLAKSMPSLQIHRGYIDALNCGGTAQQQLGSHTAGGVASAALVGVFLTIPAVVAGWLLWHRKPSRTQPDSKDQWPNEQHGLLRQEGDRPVAKSGGSQLALFPPAGKRARLAAMLRAQLDGGSSRGIEMLALEMQPGSVAHQLGSLRGRGNPSDGFEPRLEGIVANPANARLSGLRSHQADAWGPAGASIRLDADELEFVTDSTGQVVELGEGAHAVVYLGVLKGAQVAVKVFELEPGIDPKAPWREISFLRQCSHPRIVPLHGVALQPPLLMLAMELMPGGSLRAALQDTYLRQTLRWEAGGRQVAVDVAEALHYLHTQLGIMHSDLKPGNVLLTVDLRASLSDLGVAQAVGSKGRSVAGFCFTHAAPEQLMGHRCTLAADMYSFGVLLVELTTLAVVDRRGDWRLPEAPEECPQVVLNLIQECIAADPQQRCAAAEALKRLQALGDGSSA